MDKLFAVLVTVSVLTAAFAPAAYTFVSVA